MTDLVKEIRDQAIHCAVDFEIQVWDDGSDITYKIANRIISGWPGIHYVELEENLGRARIRNQLARAARYPFLLFIDGDCGIASNDFILNYLKCCHGDRVTCGGIAYSETRPPDQNRLLRWKYGRDREQKQARIRNLNPWNSFMTGNFLIAKSVFEQVAFDESIIKYGHEDTLFGIELKHKGVPVVHINNPLFHLGLDINLEFLRKTREGIENLTLLLTNRKEYENELVAAIRLLRYYRFLHRTGLKPWLMFVLGLSGKQVWRNLTGRYPNLFLFDLYKLHCLAMAEKENRGKA